MSKIKEIDFDAINKAKTAEDAAVLLFQAGFVPIKVLGKAALTEGWQKTKYADEKEVRKTFAGWTGTRPVTKREVQADGTRVEKVVDMPCNVGVLADDFYLIGNNSQETLDAFRIECPYYDATLQRQGRKPYACSLFKRQAGSKLKKTKLLTKDKVTLCDLWADGAQFVVWGIHPDDQKVKYRFLNNNPLLLLSDEEIYDLVARVAARLGIDNPYTKKEPSKASGMFLGFDLFEAVKAKVRMSQVLGTKETRIMCPLHKQKSNNPGAVIYDDKFLKCHSSGCFGDQIKVYAVTRGFGDSGAGQYKAALEMAKEYGVEIPEQKTESPGARLYDVLLNPLPEKHRFGATWINNELWYGVLVANKKEELMPAAVGSGHRLIWGRDALQAVGLRYGDFDFPSVGATWNRKLIHRHIERGESPEQAEALFSQILALNKKCVHHIDERTHTYFAVFPMAVDSFPISPQFARTAVTGLPDSGKSVQTDLTAKLCMNPIMSADATPAALKRDVETTCGLVAIDNLDNIPDEEAKAAFVQLYDTSFEDGRGARRCGENNKKTENWRTYCPMLINCESAGWMRTASRLRTIFIKMERAPEKISRKLVKLKHIQAAELEELHHKIRIWALENAPLIAKTQDELRTEMQNRDADIALPFLAVAKLISPAVYEEMLAFLTENFEQYHAEEEYTELNNLLTVLWDTVMATRDIVVTVPVKELAEKTLAAKGYERTYQTKDGTEMPAKGYAVKLGLECRTVSTEIRDKVPYVKRTAHHNRVAYQFNKLELARFLSSRRFELDGLKEVLQRDTQL